jgi:hypothetical protein
MNNNSSNEHIKKLKVKRTQIERKTIKVKRWIKNHINIKRQKFDQKIYIHINKKIQKRHKKGKK